MNTTKHTMLREASQQHNPAPAIQRTTQPSNISLDQLVDHYLFQYEKMAGPGSGTFLQEKRLTSFVFEAEDDLNLFGNVAQDDGDADNSAPPANSLQQPTPTIDLTKFASLVARLANNYQTLLDPQGTILRRVHAFVMQNYNENVAKELMNQLELNYGLSVETPTEKQAHNPKAPMAIGGAGDLLSGGGIGSGG